jgi:N-acetyl-gamma-glutamyl-phosphate reductase
MIRAGVLGPTGYSGLELLKILLRHPGAEIVYLGARREERPVLSEIWPILRGRLDTPCALLEADPFPKMDVAFLALPHTVAMSYAPPLLEKGVRVIDLSADYRLKDAAEYKKRYGAEHLDPANLGHAVYGLCEFYREQVRTATLVANPGCYPTAVELALAPLVKSGAASGERIIIDAKSGVTGAGRSPKLELHFCEANESVTAYKIGVHQHEGEMRQVVKDLAGKAIDLLFVPHLMPMDRGILATCYVPLAEPLSTDSLKKMFAEFYAEEPFVRVRTDDVIPGTKHVYDTNFCDIAVRGVGKTAVVVSCIDNLGKGAASQAVQNMNIMFDLGETTGLI